MPKIRKASRTSNIGLSGAVLVRHERHYYVHSSTFCALKQSHSFFKRITKTSGRKSLDHLQTKRLKQMIANFGAKLKIKSNTKYFSLSMIEFFTFAKAALSTDMDDVRDLFAPFGHQMNETIFDPTYFRAIYDLDFDEMTWRDESDCADTEVDQQEQQQLNSSSNSSTITKQTLDNNQTIGTEILSNTNTTATNDESNLVNQNSTSSIVESCNEDLPLVTTTYDDEDENAYMSDVDSEEETQSLLKSQAQFSEFILKASEQPRRPEFNMALFPNSSKIFENIDLCVNCFWNSPHEKTSEYLNLIIQMLEDNTRKVITSKNLQSYERLCLQIFILNAMLQLRAECHLREYDLTSTEHESLKKIALANATGSTACNKLYLSSIFKVFFNDDLPSTLLNPRSGQNSSTTHVFNTQEGDVHQLAWKWLISEHATPKNSDE